MTTVEAPRVEGTPLTIFFDFDPEMALPPKFVWRKMERPLSTRTNHKIVDLLEDAWRVLNEHCLAIGIPECDMIVNVAWNHKSDDALGPRALVGDHFEEGDTLIVNCEPLTKLGEDCCCGHGHGTLHDSAGARGHGDAKGRDGHLKQCDDGDCGHDAGHAGERTHGGGHC